MSEERLLNPHVDKKEVNEYVLELCKKSQEWAMFLKRNQYISAHTCVQSYNIRIFLLKNPLFIPYLDEKTNYQRLATIQFIEDLKKEAENE